ncbi:MAG: hypothetical protein V1706_14745 [Pseudomonadota bacterium]
MPTWKLKTETETLFYHICSSCNQKSAEALAKAGWQKIRDGEPASCRECVNKCALTSQGLWGAEDKVRYDICKGCPELAECPLKGRYYC